MQQSVRDAKLLPVDLGFTMQYVTLVLFVSWYRLRCEGAAISCLANIHHLIAALMAFKFAQVTFSRYSSKILEKNSFLRSKIFCTFGRSKSVMQMLDACSSCDKPCSYLADLVLLGCIQFAIKQIMCSYQRRASIWLLAFGLIEIRIEKRKDLLLIYHMLKSSVVVWLAAIDTESMPATFRPLVQCLPVILLQFTWNLLHVVD